MYKKHFRLQENPFSPTPPPDFIYHSAELREALAHFRYALENREAFLLLTGEVGTGKTTAVQALLRLLPEGTPVAVVTHTTLQPDELLEEVALRFGLEDVEGKTKPSLLRRLETFYEDQWRAGRQALLILDEAHLLSPGVLEEVRLLSNLERQGGKLVQICLVGQPELVGHLQRPELRQLRQRISVRYALRPLTETDTGEYMVHRLRAAGCPDPGRVFTSEAVAAVHAASNGIPREINVIAGQAMLNAFLEESPLVEKRHVASVHADYGFEGLRPVKREAPDRPISPPPPPKLAEEPRREEPSSDPDRGKPAPEGLAPRPIPLPPDHLRPPAPREASPPPRAPEPPAMAEVPPRVEPEPAPPRAETPKPPAPTKPAPVPEPRPRAAKPEPPAGPRPVPPATAPPQPGPEAVPLVQPAPKPAPTAGNRVIYGRYDDRGNSGRTVAVIVIVILVLGAGIWFTRDRWMTSVGGGDTAANPTATSEGTAPDRASETRSTPPPETPRTEPQTSAPGSPGMQATDTPSPGAGTDRPAATGGEMEIPPAEPPAETETETGTEAGTEADRGMEPETTPADEPLASQTPPAGDATGAEAGEAAEDPYAGRILLGPTVASGEYTGKVTAQIASYRSRTIADEVLLEASRRTGLQGVVLPAQVGDTLWFRILLGSFSDPEDLKEALTPLLRDNTVTEAVIRPVPEAWADRLSKRP